MYLGSINRENAKASTSKAAVQSKLKTLDNIDSKNKRAKEKGGILIAKTSEPTTKAVQTSLRTHQNFEAATRYKSRIDKNAIKPKQSGYITCLLYTSPSPRDRQKSRMPSSA